MYEMWPGLRRQHDSEVIGSESYAKTNVILMSLVSEMYPGLRRKHYWDGENHMQKPMVLRA